MSFQSEFISHGICYKPRQLLVPRTGPSQSKTGTCYSQTLSFGNARFTCCSLIEPSLFQSHPTVTTRLNNKFRSWHGVWAKEHVSDAQHKTNSDWLLGRGEGVVPNRTRVLTNNDVSKTPYRIYNRYRVDRLASESASSTAVPNAES